jgi:hypothetical protein
MLQHPPSTFKVLSRLETTLTITSCPVLLQVVGMPNLAGLNLRGCKSKVKQSIKVAKDILQRNPKNVSHCQCQCRSA